MSEKEVILKETFPEWNNYFTESGMKKMCQAMEAYADQQLKKVNDFIRDIAKLLGEDGLGFDGISWTVDDFKKAIDQEKRKEAIAFSVWNCENLWSTHGGLWYPYQDEDNPITGEQLYNLYLDHLQSLPKQV